MLVLFIFHFQSHRISLMRLKLSASPKNSKARDSFLSELYFHFISVLTFFFKVVGSIYLRTPGIH